MLAIIGIIFALIYTNNILFLDKITATLVFAFFGVAISSLWWMNVDSYNTLIKIKYADVIEKIEEKLPICPYTDEYKSIEEFKNRKIFMFSDIQKLIVAHATSGDIMRVAKMKGTISMRQDGTLKALTGVTTMEEVNRVASDLA